MTSRSSREIERALLKKGFRSTDKHHRILEFFSAGRPSGIRTYVSHGHCDYGDTLLAEVARQLCVSKAELLRLIDCTLSETDYTLVLVNRGIIS